MNTETGRISFGRYLKSRRLEKGISLKVVAGETRIGLNTLQLIENEDLGKLPAEVFTKGFLRAYAKVIGADGEEAVDVFYDGRTTTEFRTPWVDTANLHGSGDTFSAALCTMISRGIDLPDAIDSARRFTLEAIQGGKEWRLGAGHGPVSCWGLDHPEW